MKTWSLTFAKPMLFGRSGSELFDIFKNIILLRIFSLWNIYSWKMHRKIKWQIPGEPLTAQCNWRDGTDVEKHCFSCSVYWRKFSSYQQVLLAVTCLFKVTVLYFLIVHLLERSADLLSLAPSTVAYTQLLRERIRIALFDIVPSRYWKSSGTVKLPCCYKLDRQRFGIPDRKFRMAHFRKMRKKLSV